MALYLDGKEPSRGGADRGAAEGLHRQEAVPRAVRLGVQAQGRAAAPRRGGGLPALAAGHPPGAREEPQDRGRRHTRDQRQRAVLRPGLQDHDRPVRGDADLHPRLLGPAGERDGGMEPGEGQARAHRPAGADARRQARGDRRGARGGHRRGGGPQAHHHRRHPLRRASPHRAGADGVPRASDRHRHRAEDQGRSGQARDVTAEAGDRGSLVPGADRSRERADADRRHGRAASGDHRRPTAAGVQGRGQRRQAPGRVPGDHHPAGGGARTLHPADPGGAGSTGTSCSGCRPASRGRGSAARAPSWAGRCRRSSWKRRSREPKRR